MTEPSAITAPTDRSIPPLRLHVGPVDLGGSGVAAVGAVQQPDELGASRAEQPGWTDDLAGMNIEIVRLDGPAPAKSFCREERTALDPIRGLSFGALLQGLKDRQVLADHFRHQLQAWQFAGQILADQLTVAQHGDAIRDFIDLVQEMRNAEYGNALVANLPDHRHQLGDLLRVQR